MNRHTDAGSETATVSSCSGDRNEGRDMDLDDIERKVVAALFDLDQYAERWSDRRCTREVKNAVGAVGERLGFNVHAASCRYDDIREWLYDLCWCRQDDYRLVLDMPLALECEWNPTLVEILDDFQKLLVSRASHRIFLCSQPTSEDWADCVEHLTEQIRIYSGTRDGDRYLLGCWNESGWEFQQYVHPLSVAKTVRVWLFQAVPETYNLIKEMRRRQNDTWTVKRNRDNLRPGNIALLWQSGEDAGIYGCGELTSRFIVEGHMGAKFRWPLLISVPVAVRGGMTYCERVTSVESRGLRVPTRGRDRSWRGAVIF